MIGSLDPKEKQVTVVGAGISGLLVAYYLDRAGYEVTILERENRCGGLISTTLTQYGIAESAAHSLLADPLILNFFQELGVEWEELRKNSKARFIFRNGKMRRLPLNLKEVLATLWRVMFPASPRETPVKPLTLAEWGLRYLGHAATRFLLNPFVRGIYAAKPEQISVSAAFPNLMIPPGQSVFSHFLWKKITTTPKTQARRKMIAPRLGMEGLIQRLEQHLEQRLGKRFMKNTPLRSLSEAPGGPSANLILTIPAPQAALLLADRFPELSQSLTRVEYASLISVTAFVAKDQVPSTVRGVGVLVPEHEKLDCLGILFNSSSFENRVTHPELWASFTLMLGSSFLKKSDSEIQQVVHSELKKTLGIQGVPVELKIHRWTQAIPIYSPELEAIWEVARKTWGSTPGRILFGNYTGQVSLRGMIHSAAALAETKNFFQGMNH